MPYRPEKLTVKTNSENIATILSQSGKKIAKIDLNHPLWKFGSDCASDVEYMKTIELFGDTKKIEGISAHYQRGGIVIPVFSSRETKDGTKIFYDTECDSNLSIPFYEAKRDCGDKIYMARFDSYEHMQGLIITNYAGYGVLDKKTDLMKIYDKHENLIAEQIDQNKIKITSAAATKFTNLNGAAYAIVEPYGKPSCLPNGCIRIHRIKPRTVSVYDGSNKEMAHFKFYENGQMEECYQLNINGKRKRYHHYNTSGKEDTLWFLLNNKLTRNKSA